MKKINLILCACAVALTGLMVSCKNGNVEKIDVTNTETRYIYKVNGTVTMTKKSGTTTAVDTQEITYTIKDAFAGSTNWNDGYQRSYDYISEGTNEAWESNLNSYNIFIYGGEISVYNKNTPATGTATEYVLDNTNTNDPSANSLPALSIPEFGEIDGDYYVLADSAWVSADDAFDGYIGDDEFTFKYSSAAYDGRMTQTQKDANAVNNTSATYDLTFTLVSEE